MGANWTAAEDRILVDTHDKEGDEWDLIAESLPGRTADQVKIRLIFLKRSEGGCSVEGD
jgi:hypothetical protein